MLRHLTIAVLGAVALMLALPFTALADDTAALQRASERGRMLYDFDQAAWVGTDALQRDIPDLAASHIGGWIVEYRSGLAHVIFYRTDTPQPTALYVADVHGRTLASAHRLGPGEDATLTPVELRMIAARAIAKQQPRPQCVNAPTNTVVLPPRQAGDPISVYMLTPQVKTGDYPAGGHYEIDVADNGSVIFTRRFTNTCIMLGASPSDGNGKPVAAFLTHLLDPTPTEIHVYLSLWMGQPLYVSTGPDRVWEVNGDHIRLVAGK
jgi:hypothetical protein